MRTQPDVSLHPYLNASISNQRPRGHNDCGTQDADTHPTPVMHCCQVNRVIFCHSYAACFAETTHGIVLCIAWFRKTIFEKGLYCMTGRNTWQRLRTTCRLSQLADRGFLVNLLFAEASVCA